MKTSEGQIEVYHAGTERVEGPICTYGRTKLDFGQGFYVTDIYDQALNFAKVKASDRKREGIINVYHLDKEAFMNEGRCLIFEHYDRDWLEFIVACRTGKELWKQYDYIEGGVADDRVINTVNLYIQGMLPQEVALRNLRYLKPNNQICLLNQEMTDKCLKFIDSIKVTNNGLV